MKWAFDKAPDDTGKTDKAGTGQGVRQEEAKADGSGDRANQYEGRGKGGKRRRQG